MRSSHIRNAARSPASTSSTALRVSASHSLFALFYLVEIRHRQLLQSQSRTR
jgi:hypothetical protein